MRCKLISFLLTAKRATYAAQGDDASVPAQLPGAKQLEYREGPYFYRDIYFGMEMFTGMETVYHLDQPLWAMSYGGGVINIGDREQIRSIYAFLREALRLGSEEAPYRGPDFWKKGPFTYMNHWEGTWERFYGYEEIHLKDTKVYELRYQGGLLS
ncbi:DUF5680 domain-containing protein [Polycladomyces subterraneus]|uniref:DUF5680 domain-containing protein n=1 Tax=Polycladomyces subterraneus TaxID=1016997 RepID=A0ABT8IL07_9BACL|nr:DUF5680 domain-containing protein [Polycladomyces subterraneus]MDN4593236.1 DUF5680 domain-containing protein [Polycladomyces subterraneus]